MAMRCLPEKATTNRRSTATRLAMDNPCRLQRVEATQGASGVTAKTEAHSEGAVPQLVQKTLQSTGEPLNDHSRVYFERRLGEDLSNVRIQHGREAARAAQAVNAKAFTMNHDIVFADDQYSPATFAGQRLLAHELAHVVQLTGARGAAPSTLQRKVDACENWSPVNDEEVRTIIQTAVRAGSTYGEALSIVIAERNKDANCCSLSYTAADHYLVIRDQAGKSCSQAMVLAGLSTSRALARPLIPRTGNCPVSPYDSAVEAWESLAVIDVCKEEHSIATPNREWLKDDSDIRNWVRSHTQTEVDNLPREDRLTAIYRLLSGWISDDDLDAIEILCNGVPSKTLADEIRRNVRLLDITSVGQRTRMRFILDNIPK
ncbi:MAG: DUF4157 domain-containing protein [Cyanobacteriota bacterium]